MSVNLVENIISVVKMEESRAELDVQTDLQEEISIVKLGTPENLTKEIENARPLKYIHKVGDHHSFDRESRNRGSFLPSAGSENRRKKTSSIS